MGQPIVHFEIMGKDARKLHKFYAELFDWNVGEAMPDMGMYGLVPEESSRLPGGIGEEPEGTPRTTFYVEVPDLQAALDKAVSLGGTVVMPPMDIPGIVSLAQFADPDGNVIGLTKAGTP